MRLRDLLNRTNTYAGTPHTQPVGATVGTVNHELKHISREPFFYNVNNTVMGTSPVGWTVENPVILNGIPAGKVITGTAETRTTDAPKNMRCD